MWPYNDDEFEWLDARRPAKADPLARGEGGSVVIDSYPSPQMIAASIAEGRRQRAEAFATLIGQASQTCYGLVARILPGRRAVPSRHLRGAA